MLVGDRRGTSPQHGQPTRAALAGCQAAPRTPGVRVWATADPWLPAASRRSHARSVLGLVPNAIRPNLPGRIAPGAFFSGMYRLKLSAPAGVHSQLPGTIFALSVSPGDCIQ